MLYQPETLSMKETKKHFYNELGNAIEIRVEDKEIDSVRGVLLTIIGPTSDTEVHITRQEAEVLFEQLGLVLSST